MCLLYYPLFLLSFIPMPFLLLHVSFVSSCCMSPLPMFILYEEWRGLFSLALPCFLSSLLGLVSLLGMISYQTNPLGFHYFLSFFLRLLWPICFYLALLLPLIVLVDMFAAISYHAGPLGVSSFFLSYLSFYGPFVSILLCFYLLLCLWAYLLPFSAILAHWVLFISFFLL